MFVVIDNKTYHKNTNKLYLGRKKLKVLCPEIINLVNLRRLHIESSCLKVYLQKLEI